ncbi:hypothetical protein [Oricola nitratireducens]|jgi:hypothetical protein|uniref:hypothetical protein n=1 Tax=Oricola nitratireducens TaxID=2775868 RepID=UPI001868ED74|nr:hypothetical protein [Oricola nitratireducens]
MTMKAHTAVTDVSNSADGYVLREAVAVFDSEEAFLGAVDDLQEHGFDRSELSVLADGRYIGSGVSRLFAGARALTDIDSLPRAAVVSPDALAEAEAAAVGLPVYIGTLGGFLAAAATGGALAATIPLALAGGLAGGGLGALGARIISDRHRSAIERQLDVGGIVLWVRTRTPDFEERALSILKSAGGTDAHVHEAVVRWGVDDIPLSHVNPDPLLERSAEYD